MTTTNDTDDADASARPRLDGWKAIASYFGRGVRTVQRWEIELHLPVRRIDTGRGQVTYAFVDELDRWRESAGVRKATSESAASADDEGAVPSADCTGNGIPAGVASRAAGGVLRPSSAVENAGRRPRRRRLAAGLAAVAVAALSGIAWVWLAGPAVSGGPASAQVLDNALRVFDATGRLLWKHEFGFTLTAGAYTHQPPGRNSAPIVIEDVDADGHAEVLFVAEPWLPDSPGLYCFNRDGSVRFHHVPVPIVEYGAKTYAPPWRGVSVYVTGAVGRPRDIWFVSTHLVEFPTLLEKLDGSGHLAAQYWSNGQITFFTQATVGRRSLIFVGAISNEFKGGSLAVLDPGSPSGSAPAISRDYACRGCPPAQPLAFLVFPRLDLTEAIGSHSNVSNVFCDHVGQILVDVHHDVGDGVPQEFRSIASTHYGLDGQFRVAVAGLGERLPQVHGLFERKGILDHRFSRERDERSLWPVRRWIGGEFAKVSGVETQDRK